MAIPGKSAEPARRVVLHALVAVPVLAVAGGLRIGFLGAHWRGMPFLTFFPAVMVASMLGGFPAGVLATLLAMLLTFFWTLGGRMTFPEPLGFAMFGACALGVASLVESRRRSRIRTEQSLASLQRAKEHLEGIEKPYRFNELILDCIQEGVIVYGPDLRYQAWNPFMEHLTACPAREVLGKHPWEAFPFLAETGIRAHLERALAGEIVGAMEVNIQDPVSGRSSWTTLTSAPLRDAQGAVIGVIATVSSDISKRKESERALRESEKRFRHVASSMMDIAYSCKRKAGEAFVLDWLIGATDALVGRPIEEIKAANCWASFLVEADLPLFRKHVIGLAPGESSLCELRLRKQDGGLTWFESHAHCECLEEDPDQHRLYGALVDITERKRAEEDQTRRNQDLARETQGRRKAEQQILLHQQEMIQADKMASLGVLVSGVAHEINNPTGLILLNLPILQACFHDALAILDHQAQDGEEWSLAGLPYQEMRGELPKLIEEMLDGAHRIKQTVNGLKDFARREDTGRKAPEDLNHMLQVAIRLVEGSLGKSTHRFTLELAPELPRIHCNAQRVEQVLVNLLLNACQALRDRNGGIRVATHFDPGTGAAICQVQDQGVGIAPENLPRILDPFFTTKRDQGGTGLGLSVSAAITKDYGGTLAFESQLGLGTTATLTLPVISMETSQ